MKYHLKKKNCFSFKCCNCDRRGHGMRCCARANHVFAPTLTERSIQTFTLFSHLDTPALWGTMARTGCDQLLQCPARCDLTLTWTITSSPCTRESSVWTSFACWNHKHHGFYNTILFRTIELTVITNTGIQLYQTEKLFFKSILQTILLIVFS